MVSRCDDNVIRFIVYNMTFYLITFYAESNLSCPLCKEKFQSLAKYGYHKAEMHGIMRPYDCILCSDEFCTRHELFLHLHNHIDTNTSTDTLTCDKCNSKFSLKEHFEQHMNSHSKEPLESFTPTSINHDDDDMLDDFESSVESNAHATTTFNCNNCNKSFEHQTILQHHRVTEHEPKKYPCTIGFCDQMFTTLDLLRTHTMQQHNENNLSNYQTASYLNECKIDGCKRTFQYPSRLERHMSTHVLDEYECSRCKRMFYSEAVFRQHTNGCTVVADDHRTGPVVCTLCCQLFENEAVLENHRRFCTDDLSSIFSEDDTTNISSVFDSQLNTPMGSPGYFSIKSPESMLSVYVQNDCDSNFMSEL